MPALTLRSPTTRPPGPRPSPTASPADDGTGCQVVVVTATTPSGGGPTIYTKELSNPAEATAGTEAVHHRAILGG